MSNIESKPEEEVKPEFKPGDLDKEIQEEKERLLAKAQELGLHSFRAFCVGLTRLELKRIKDSMRTLKKMGREYEAIQNKLRYTKSQVGVEAVLDDYPEYMLSYYQFIEQEEKKLAEQEAKSLNPEGEPNEKNQD